MMQGEMKKYSNSDWDEIDIEEESIQLSFIECEYDLLGIDFDETIDNEIAQIEIRIRSYITLDELKRLLDFSKQLSLEERWKLIYQITIKRKTMNDVE